MRHKCLASFVVFVLFFTLSAFIGFGEMRGLLKTEVILKILNTSRLYETLPKYLEVTLSKGGEIEPQAKILSSAIVKAIDEKELKEQIEKNLPPLMNYLNSQGPMPDFSFDLRPFKKRFAVELPTSLFEGLENLPPCTEEDKLQEQAEIPSCLAVGTTTGQLEQELQKNDLSGEILKQIPDTWGLRDLKNPEQIFGQARLTFKILNFGFWISLALSILLIFLLVLLGRGYWPSIPRWVGLSLLLPGISMLLLTFVSLFLPKIFLGNYASGTDPEIIKMVNPLIISLNQASQTTSLLYSGVMTGLGFLLILLSYILPHPPEPKPVAKPAVQPTVSPASEPKH